MKLVILIALALCGCSTVPKRQAAMKAPGAPTITLAWTCPGWISHSTYDTGLITSTDLVHWQEIIVFPYSNHVMVTLAKTNDHQFYRVFSRWSPNCVIE